MLPIEATALSFGTVETALIPGIDWQTDPVETSSVELDITGMTCAACASRIERRLNRLDGVDASVNYATERATIRVVDAQQFDIEALIATVEATGYGAQPASLYEPIDRAAGLRRRLGVAIVLGAPVLVLSMIPALQFRGWQWVVLVLATPVTTWVAWPFHRSMVLNLRHRQATMDTLISVGVTAAYLWSLWALLFTDAGQLGMKMSMSFTATGHGGDHGGSHDGGGSAGVPHLYFEVASTVVAFLIAGRYFEARAKQRAGDALRALLELGAKDVTVIDAQGTEIRIPIEDLTVGQRFVVRPGEKIATDGEVVDGVSAVDVSLVTGESVPVEVGPGDAVIGATLNSGGRLVVRATRVGSDTQLAQMAQLVETAQSGKAPVQRLADRVSAIFVPVVITLSILTLVGWWIIGGALEPAFTAAVAVLIIACPCALGLATPTALLVGTGRGAQMGVLIRGPEILESTRRVDTVVLDKTGTVTTGAMALITFVAVADELDDQLDDDTVLHLAASLEMASEHPIGRAIAAAARRRTVPVDGFVATAGVGVSGVVDGWKLTAERAPVGNQLAGPGRTVVALLGRRTDTETPYRTLGLFAVADRVREDSAVAIEGLRELGLTPILLSGDERDTVRAVAQEIGIDEVRAEVLPADKVAVVADLQAEGKVVAMVGDGVNDAAALATADLGIAMGSGTDVAIEASDLTLVRTDLGAVVDAIGLSRRTLATIKGNLFWAFAYNTAAIPLAMAGLLSPLIAGVAMAFSSVFVVTNSLRLRRFGRSSGHGSARPSGNSSGGRSSDQPASTAARAAW